MFKKSFFRFALILSIVCLVSCKSDEPSYNNKNGNSSMSDCERYRTATVIFNNWSKDPYDCYIDGVYKGRVAGYGEKYVYSVPAGYHSFKVVQASGYILYASEYTTSGTLSACGNYTIEFP
jgi:hypothetical protein